jgi:hypothetical protein
MSTTTLPAFMDALVTALQARIGLAGVNIYSGPVAPEDLGSEGIEFAEEVSVEQTRAAMNSTDQEETYTVGGSILVAKSFGASTSAVATINVAAKAARDRVAAILEEVTDQLATSDTMTGTVRDVRIASQTWRQGMAPEGQLGRVCWCEFTMEVTAHVTP